MTATATELAPPPATTAAPQAPGGVGPTMGEVQDYASKLRNMSIACRIQHEKFGVRKALSRDQIKVAAGEFDATADVLTATKRILDTTSPPFRAVIGVRRRATQFWKSMTIPYPEPGVRLLRKSSVEQFNQKMKEFSTELDAAAAQLQQYYEELVEQARQTLGTLFNKDDYPPHIDTEFSLSWDYPSIEPPAYLKQLHPELYQQQ
ncbi:MAG: hypothetical protein QOE14_1979, partial [Humisphaera sp.]|nr:hypothetical protein [Humisphaera sp.]